MDCSPPGSSVHGILQARLLEWVAISFSRDRPHLGIKPALLKSPKLAGGFFTISAVKKGHLKKKKKRMAIIKKISEDKDVDVERREPVSTD